MSFSDAALHLAHIRHEIERLRSMIPVLTESALSNSLIQASLDSVESNIAETAVMLQDVEQCQKFTSSRGSSDSMIYSGWFSRFPVEIMVVIFEKLAKSDPRSFLRQLPLVCKRFHSICTDNVFWRRIFALIWHDVYAVGKTEIPDWQRRTLERWTVSSWVGSPIISCHARHLPTFDPISAVCFGSTRETMFSASFGGSVKFWRAMQCVWTVNCNNEPVNCLTNCSDGVYVCGNDLGDLFEFNEGGLIRVRERAHAGCITTIASLSNGRYVSGSYDKTLKVWHYRKEGDCQKTLCGHTNIVTILSSIIGKSGGEYVVSASLDRTVKLWNISSGECLHTIELPSECTALASCPTMVLFAHGNNIERFDPRKPDTSRELVHTTDSAVFSFQIADRLWFAASKRTILLGDCLTKNPPTEVSVPRGAGVFACFHYDYTKLAVGCSERMLLLHANTGAVLSNQSSGGGVRCIQSWGDRVVFGNERGSLYTILPDHSTRRELLSKTV